MTKHRDVYKNCYIAKAFAFKCNIRRIIYKILNMLIFILSGI